MAWFSGKKKAQEKVNMKMEKTLASRILMVLFYMATLAVTVVVMLLVMVKAGILAGLGTVLALGVAIGIAGGELEFRIHWKTLDKREKAEKEMKIAKKIVPFRAKETQP